VINTLSLDQVPPQRWRNGGGSTRQMLTWPTAHDWSVRISVAQIAQNGPFSAFPCIERWFAVVRGEGVGLRFGGAETIQPRVLTAQRCSCAMQTTPNKMPAAVPRE
jgi:environmental stress-induced protein Ves